MRVLIKRVVVGAACLFALVIAFGIWLFGPHRADVGRYKMESVEVRLFVEASLENGDILYYSIRKHGVEVVPRTYVTSHDRKIRLNVHTAFSTDKSVLGLWADGTEVFILYHVPSSESWPRLRDDEAPYTPSVMAKWHERYLTLQRNNKDLPIPKYFQDGEVGR